MRLNWRFWSYGQHAMIAILCRPHINTA